MEYINFLAFWSSKFRLRSDLVKVITIGDFCQGRKRRLKRREVLSLLPLREILQSITRPSIERILPLKLPPKGIFLLLWILDGRAPYSKPRKYTMS